jgi:hypothetical protein
MFRLLFGVALLGTIHVTAWSAGDSALSNEAKPLQVDEVPQRVRPILELGDTFLGAGNVNSGFTLPTGAVWQPNFIMWGTYRTAVNSFDDEIVAGDERVTEWVNRMDLFGQLSLSQTERIVIGFRPFDENGEFSGYRFNPNKDSVDAFNTNINLLFFEGNLAEIFPKSGRTERRRLDLDFSIGRQPFLFQEGTLVVDTMDAIAFSRNNITVLPKAVNSRVAVTYSWGEVNRGNNVEDPDANLFGLFTETDFPLSTVNLDFVYVDSNSTGDGFYAGLSAAQRLGKANTAFRILHSDPTNGSTLETTRGTLTVAEISWTPAYTYNNVYTNFFWAIDDFQSASRDAATGGPLGLIGILYAATGLGAYPAPLGNNAIESVGGAAGYQMFFSNERRQLILEIGARTDTDGTDRTQGAIGARYQQAFSHRYVLRFDGFLSEQQNFDAGWGGRVELQVKL